MAAQLEAQSHAVLEVLRAQAEARNMGLAEYLQLFADAGQMTPASGELSSHEFEALLDQLSEGLTLSPVLPADFSRAHIYAEHD